MSTINQFQNRKNVKLIQPISVAAGAVTISEVDGLDFSAIVYSVQCGVGATTFSAFKVQHSDTTGANFVDTGAEAIQTGSVAGKTFELEVWTPLRFTQLVLTTVTNALIMSIEATLYKGREYLENDGATDLINFGVDEISRAALAR